MLKDIAADFGVTISTVCKLSKKAERNKNFLKDLLDGMGDKEWRRKIIADKVTAMNKADAFVDSALTVKLELEKDLGMEATLLEIRKVMREDLDMTYRKVLPIPIHGNSGKNLVLRQQFARRMIQLLLEGKTIINFDESWINMTDFRRRKWQAPNTTNSVAALQTADRISMIAALDSQGSVYLSLLQSNSNGRIMDIFLRQLVL